MGICFRTTDAGDIIKRIGPQFLGAPERTTYNKKKGKYFFITLTVSYFGKVFSLYTKYNKECIMYLEFFFVYKFIQIYANLLYNEEFMKEELN